jgi:hypothetical protein
LMFSATCDSWGLCFPAMPKIFESLFLSRPK